MKITIIINETELQLRKAIAKGWNARFNEDLTFEEISDVSNKEDILGAIPYLDSDNIKIESIEWGKL